MDIEIDDEDDGVQYYFTVSVWQAQNLISNDPYVLVKYGEQELKTRVEHGPNPTWQSHVMFARAGRDLDLYIFDYEDFMSDDILGKVSLSLPDFTEPVFTVLDHQWLPVQPCLTAEQDTLLSYRNNLSRKVTKAVRFFADDAHLFRKELGEIQVSVTAFRLDELPALIRSEGKKELEADLVRQRRKCDELKRQLNDESMSLDEIKARIQALTFAYYAQLRKPRDAPSSPVVKRSRDYASPSSQPELRDFLAGSPATS